MIRNISSFGKILKAEGLGIKSIAQTAFKDKEGAHFVVNLNNGDKGVYTVARGKNTNRQSLSSNGKVVEYTTKKFPELGWEVYSKKPEIMLQSRKRKVYHMLRNRAKLQVQQITKERRLMKKLILIPQQVK